MRPMVRYLYVAFDDEESALLADLVEDAVRNGSIQAGDRNAEALVIRAAVRTIAAAKGFDTVVLSLEQEAKDIQEESEEVNRRE